MNNSTDDVTKALRTLGLNSTTGLLGQYLFWASNVERIIGPAFPSVVFRGHALGDWELFPTLCRKPTVRGLGKADAEAGARYVDQCEMVVKMRFREQFELNGWTDLEVLALAQHYKAPTTLLDWTANPLSGLWFAVDDARYTRGQATLHALPGEPLVLAKAGLKPPKSMKEDRDHNDWIIDMFLRREPGTKLVYNVLRVCDGGGVVKRRRLSDQQRRRGEC